MNHKNNVWTQLCEQLVVIFAIILLFCLLPDFSDGKHFVSHSDILKSVDEFQPENIEEVKPIHKRKKKKSASTTANQNNNHFIASSESVDLAGETFKEELLTEANITNSLKLSKQIQEESVPLSAAKLNRVEKINTEIEEQLFVLTVQQEQDKLTDEVLAKIESNLLTIKKMAQQEGIDSLIDNPGIAAIDKKIALYRENS